MAELITGLLQRRVRTDGASPLLTYYDLDSGERTELSATSFANWVAKTAHLLLDELMLDEGDRVELALARSHPGHWVTLIWELACWRTGIVVSVDPRAGRAALVIGPDTDWTTSGEPVVACSLHPLGLPGPSEAPILDYNTEVRGQPDRFDAASPPPTAPAWHSPGTDLDQSDLLSIDPTTTGRRLILPTDPWSTTRDALLRPLVAGGSSVIVTGHCDPTRLAHLRETERCI